MSQMSSPVAGQQELSPEELSPEQLAAIIGGDSCCCRMSVCTGDRCYIVKARVPRKTCEAVGECVNDRECR